MPTKRAALPTFQPKPKPAWPTAWGGKRAHSKYIKTSSDQLAWNRGFRFFPALVEHFTDFCRDNLVFVRGSRTGEPVEWLDFQRDEIFGPMLGWVHKEKHTRRIRRAYVELTKKQGKTTLAACLCLYFMLADGEGGAQVYSNGPSMLQAGLAWDIAADMIEFKDAPLSRYNFQIHRHDRLLRSPEAQALWKALGHTSSGRRGTAQGLDASMMLNDELHEWPGYDHWRQITKAGRARKQALMLSITNAGRDKDGPCWDEHQYACQVSNSELMDITFHSFVRQTDEDAANAEIDAVADGSDEIPVAIAANPAIGLIVEPDEILRDIREAGAIPGERGNVLRLTYSVWRTFGDNPYIGHLWEDCERDFSVDECYGLPCWFGLDIAAVKDFTALAMVFEVEPREEYRAVVHYWISEARMHELTRIERRFEEWMTSPFVHVNPGNTTSHTDVRNDVTRLVNACRWTAGQHEHLPQLIYDPRMADVITSDVEDETGCLRVEFTQTAQNYHAPVEKLEKLVFDQKLHHTGDGLLGYQAGNCSASPNTAEHRRPIRIGKEGDHRTIDGIVAILMALSESDKPLPRKLDHYEQNELEMI